MNAELDSRPASTIWLGLHDLISKHRPIDGVESQSLFEISQAWDAGPEKLLKSTRGAHFTVSCLCLDARMEQALMIVHKKLGRLLQPGGHIEPGDASFQLEAMREVSEETLPSGSPPATLMLDGALLDVDAHDIASSASMPAHRHLDLRFLARMHKSYKIWHNPTESSAALWVPLTELALNPDASLARMARKTLKIVAARPRGPKP